ncbi:SDR family oxidoreductase [Mycolicibacter minnesotensis]
MLPLPGWSKRAIRDKVIAITGGARGIGFATAQALAEKGARVVIADIDADQVAKSAADLGITGLELDVTQSDSFRDFLNQVNREHGHLDILINNAGIMPTGPFLGYSEQLIRRTIEIDLLGVINGSRLAAARMVARGRGHIINVASIAGRVPAPGLTVYNAAKFGVIGFSEALNSELESYGVRVSTVQPSHTTTELIDGLNTAGIPTVTPQHVAATVLKVIRTQQLHAYPTTGTQVIGAFGAVPGPVKRRIMKTQRYRELFMSADANARADYVSRIAKS